MFLNLSYHENASVALAAVKCVNDSNVTHVLYCHPGRVDVVPPGFCSLQELFYF